MSLSLWFCVLIWQFCLKTNMKDTAGKSATQSVALEVKRDKYVNMRVQWETWIGGKIAQIRNSRFSIIVRVEYWIWNLQFLTFIINLTPFSIIFPSRKSLQKYMIFSQFQAVFFADSFLHLQHWVEFWARLSTKQCTCISIYRKFGHCNNSSLNVFHRPPGWSQLAKEDP